MLVYYCTTFSFFFNTFCKKSPKCFWSFFTNEKSVISVNQLTVFRKTSSTNKLRVMEKFDDADVLTYQIIGEKVPAARFVYVFVLNGDKPLLNDLKVLLPKAKQEAAGK